MTYAEAVQHLDALYAALPSVPCRGKCAAACGPLALSYVERLRVQRGTWRTLQDVTQPACPLLKAQRCTAYGLRPLICRLYGVSEQMQCPHGCLPDRWLSQSETEALLHIVEEISQAVFPTKGTCSFHSVAAILQAQHHAAERLCAVLTGSQPAYQEPLRGGTP